MTDETTTSFDQRDQIWDVCFETYYDCYFEEMAADVLLYRWCLVDDSNKWLIAIAASGSVVSGWALWNELWVILSLISAVLAITHTALGIQQRIKNWEDAKKSFVDLRLSFAELRQDMSIDPNFNIDAVLGRLNALRAKYREQMSRLGPDTLRTKRLEEKIQAKLNDTISDQIQEI